MSRSSVTQSTPTNKNKVSKAFKNSHSANFRTNPLKAIAKESKREKTRKKNLEPIPIPSPESFGIWLAVERTKRRLTQWELARFCGLSQSAISLIELGKRPKYRRKTMQSIYQALDRIRPKNCCGDDGVRNKAMEK